MKIIHFSDTHLGITLENTTREDDFYVNFEIIINDIIKQKPTAVIHTGDLFHSPKPSNKAISIVIKNFLRLKENNIKVIIIAGNHDTPRLSTTTHPFEIFKTFDNFYTFYEKEIGYIDIENIRFTCLPHIHDEVIFKTELSKSVDFIDNTKKNIFLSHFGLSGKEYDEYTDEISGINISIDELKKLKKFDYVALGHYHKNFCMGNICYAGSLEHTSFNQKNYKNGYNIIELTDKINIKNVYLKTREMIDFGNIDCNLFEKTDDLIDYLEKNIQKDKIVNSIIKITFENINNKLILDFNEKIIYNFFENSFYFEYKKIRLNKQNKNISNIINNGNIINDSFDNFIENYKMNDKKIEIEIIKDLKAEIKKI